MKTRFNQARFLIGSILLIVLIADSCLAGHKDDDDDDDDDDDPQCYLGRNCRPGCYCSGNYCRPYFHPSSAFLARYQCTGYNYPKWKIKTKGHKHGGKNSTIVVITDPNHHNLTEPSISVFAKETIITQDDNEAPVLMTTQYSTNVTQTDTGKMSLLSNVTLNSTTPSVIDLIYTPSTISPA